MEEIRIEFPKFITHAPLSKNKWAKIGYNKIHSSPHFSIRNAFVGAMHTYIEKHMPTDLKVEGAVETSIIIYVPINFGSVRSLMNKKTGNREIRWSAPAKDYVPNWDIFNLAAVWLKSLDDAVIHAGILPDDNVAYFRGFGGKVVFVDTFEERKMVYVIKKLE